MVLCLAGTSAARQLSPNSLRGLLSNAAAGPSAGNGAVIAKPKKVQQAMPDESTTNAAGSGQWLNTKPTGEQQDAAAAADSSQWDAGCHVAACSCSQLGV
jgi:hypothetical protein